MFRMNYDKPGPGVQKRDPNQSRISIFFELLRRKLWNLSKLNMLYLLTAIPFFIVTMVIMGLLSSRITDALMPLFNEVLGTDANASTTILWFDIILRFAFSLLFTVFLGQGPVTAGYTYILRNYGREEHAYPVSDFFEHAKSNFGQAICLWIIDLVVFILLTTAIFFYASMNGLLAFINIFVFMFALIYLMMHLYIYQIMITFKLPLKAIFKNAFIFAMSQAPKNMLLLLILVLIHIVVPYFFIFVYTNIICLLVFYLLELVLLTAVSGFMTNFFVYPSLAQCIKDAEEIQESTEDEAQTL